MKIASHTINPSRKDIAIVGIASVLVYAIIFGMPIFHWFPSVYTGTITFTLLALLVPVGSFYLDYKNPTLSGQVRAINIKKIIAICTIAVMANIAMVLFVSMAQWMSGGIFGDGLTIGLMVVVPLMSLYFDYCKMLADRSKTLGLVTISLLGIIVMGSITYLYYQNFLLITPFFEVIFLALALTNVLVVPLISLKLDINNPSIGKNNKKFSQTKVKIVITIGLLAILTIILSIVRQFVYYL